MGSGPSKLGVKRVAIGDWGRNENRNSPRKDLTQRAQGRSTEFTEKKRREIHRATTARWRRVTSEAASTCETFDRCERRPLRVSGTPLGRAAPSPVSPAGGTTRHDRG